MFKLNDKSQKQNQPESQTPESSKEEKNQPGQQQKNLNEKPETVSSPPSSTDAPPEWAGELGVERGTADEAEAEAQGLQTATAMLDQESFHKVFCGGFTAVGHMTGLESLMVDEADGKAAACTQALYETILDVPMLHFLLMPQNKWLGRAMAIGMFTIPMVNAVKNEIAMKQLEQEEGNGSKLQTVEKSKKSAAFEVPDFDRTGKNEAV